MSVEIIRLLNCDGEDCPSGEAFDPGADCTPVAEGLAEPQTQIRETLSSGQKMRIAMLEGENERLRQILAAFDAAF